MCDNERNSNQHIRLHNISKVTWTKVMFTLANQGI